VNKRIGIANIKRVLAMATEEENKQGLAWYKQARLFCRRMSRTYGVSLDVAIAVLSALSPRNKWANNLRDVETVLAACKQGLGPNDVRVTTFNANKEKAFRIVHEGKPILAQTSNKTACFFDNIRHVNSDNLTIDLWAFGVFMGFRACQGTLTDTQYETIASCYRSVAKSAGLRPYEVQAIVWITFKRLTAKHNVVQVTPANYGQSVTFKVAA